MTKHEKPQGVKEKSDRAPKLAGGLRPCWFHQKGVPIYAKGQNWCDKRCPTCLEKLARGEVTADAPDIATWRKMRRQMFKPRHMREQIGTW